MPHPETEAILDEWFPARGKCGLCGQRDQRHRVCDMIRGRFRAGDTIQTLADDYDVDEDAISVLVKLSPSAYGWWMRKGPKKS